MITSVFRQQHKALLELAAKMPAKVAAIHEAEVRAVLFKLTGALRVHLKLEDERLYPMLLAHSLKSVRDMAARFQREMGGLLEAYNAFHAKWSVTGAVSSDPGKFLHHWAEIVNALGLRIGREDNELYALADKVVDPPAA
ncbi:MAG: hemerythrin domain-containing protein [Candidatus Eremiobacteraeota bacterium]|nr:hemerythrin domain-containing protein [Candidatus Eremiobacteraeota bacterium]